MPDDGHLGKKLEKMIQRRDNEKVMELLKQLGSRKAAVFVTQEGLPLLHLTILHHNHYAARLLLDRGADPCFTDSRGRSALHAAAEADSVGVVVDLLKRCSINSQDENGDTALHIAVQKCSVEMVKWLIFAGADPYILNKEKYVCQKLTTKNLIRQLLRNFNLSRPPITFAQLVPNKPCNVESLHLSVSLPEWGASGQADTDFLYYATSPHGLTPASLSNLNMREEEEVWGSVLEYRLAQPQEVTLNFNLLEVTDAFSELVLRLLDTDSATCQDLMLNIQEFEPAKLSTAATESLSSATAADASPAKVDDDLAYVAYVQERVRLAAAGLLLLLCRPVQQDVSLGGGEKRKIQAKLDPRVEVSVPDDFERVIHGQLQLEPSCPLNESPPLVRAPVAAPCEYDSQTDYVKLRTAETAVVVTADLPLPDDFSGGMLHLIVRMNSKDFTYKSFRRDSTTSESDSEIEDEKEAQRWTEQTTFRVSPNSKTITVPMPANQTMTVVETKKASSEEKVKKRVAKQYRKTRQKRAVFFVAARPWIGWRVCRDVLTVVTSPAHLSRELGRHLKDGYNLLYVSGEFRVPPLTDFRLSVISDNLFVEHGHKVAVITFRHVLHLEQSGNHCNFVLRKKKSNETKGRLLVEQKKKKKTKDGSSLWKVKGELHFDTASVTEDLRVPSDEEQEMTTHFSDTLLLDLAEKLQSTQGPELGQKLGLSTPEMDKVLKNPSLISDRFKSFELLRRRRDRSLNAMQYGRCLLQALADLNCSDQRQWLLRRLANWPQLNEVTE